MTTKAIIGTVVGTISVIIVGLIAIGSSSTPTPTPTFTPTPTEVATITPIPETSPSAEPVVQGISGETATVAKVTDGDTIELSDGRKVRYIGIDTPETVHPSKSVQCLGKEASIKNRELVEGKTVQLEKDISETDRYGRLLRYVYVDGKMVNETLVLEGFATASSYPPDVKYQDRLRQAEQSARNNKWGLWSDACAATSPMPSTAGTTQGTQTKAPTPTKQSTPTKQPTPAAKKPAAQCSADTYNCTDFSTCSEVMTVFNACSGDPHGLDGDDDGVPCEDKCG